MCIYCIDLLRLTNIDLICDNSKCIIMIYEDKPIYGWLHVYEIKKIIINLKLIIYVWLIEFKLPASENRLENRI